MIDLSTQFYYVTINAMHPMLIEYWDSFYNKLKPQARLEIDIARYFGKNRIINRKGEWKSPWKTQVVPGFEMPDYDPNFKMSFEEVTNKRATDIKDLINKTDARVAVYYSGGIDSATCLVALLKNLTAEELKHIDVAMSAESVIENPAFFEKHIFKKLNIIDSFKLRYSDIERAGNYAITSDQGDSIFGTELGTQMYYSYKQILNKISPESRRKLENYHLRISDKNTHFSEYADMIIAYFELEGNPGFGKQFYEKFIHNINTSGVPVHSLHDFFWWYIFNLKYLECALRSTIYYYGGTDRKTSIHKTIINWFNDPNYQKWSMVNNNNGQKIKGVTAATYKWVAKEYIYGFDKNEWFFKYKLKVSSFKNIVLRNKSYQNDPQIFAMDNKYNLYYFEDSEVRSFIEKAMIQFE